MANQDQPEAIRNRGIYLLPNLLTTATIFAGFFAIVIAGSGDFSSAAVAIFVAMVTDGLDGTLARLTNTQTAFGQQFDSLADMVAFGVGPALVMQTWALSSFGKLGWAVAFIYVATTGLRLARFNVQAAEQQKTFKGLPCTLAAGMMAGYILMGEHYQLTGTFMQVVALVITLLASVLMVSAIPYWSTKALQGKPRISIMAALAIAVVFAVIALDPPLVLFAVFLGYGLSGPIQWLLKAFNVNFAKVRMRLLGLSVLETTESKK